MPQLSERSHRTTGGIVAISLYLIAFLEGFATLGVELYAVRASASVIGASITVTGILLGAILVALSLGYHFGGRAATRMPQEKLLHAVAARLAAAAVIYTALLPLHGTALLLSLSLTRDVALGTLLVSCLYVPPAMLASQCLPLLAQRLSGQGAAAGEAAGLFLAVSTVGSVAGSTLTSVVLFGAVGVKATAGLLVIVLAAAALLAWAMARRSERASPPLASGLALLAAIFAGTQVFRGVVYNDSFDTAYQSLVVEETEENGRLVRHLRSGILLQTSVDAETLAPAAGYTIGFMRVLPEHIRSAMVIGAAGFAIPEALAARGVATVAVDVDPAVRAIAEKAFLKRPLSKLVRFVAEDARLALRTVPQTFDIVFLDAFAGIHPPQHLLTVEALSEMRAKAPLVVANVIFDAPAGSTFAARTMATWKAVFPEAHAVKIPPTHGSEALANVLLCSGPCPGGAPIPDTSAVPYTDDRNTIEVDGEAVLAALVAG